MSMISIINGKLVNEGEISQQDLLIEGNRIAQIGNHIKTYENVKVIDASGKYIIPGLIDDQVHFREPGLTHKASIASESKAALAGGITSFLEMPNTNPQTTTIKEWDLKNEIASKSSFANYGFMFGGTNDNLDQIIALDPKTVPALKLFLGSSTGNMLINDPEVLKSIFENTKLVIAVHCEDEDTIRNNLESARLNYGENIPIEQHPFIRSEEACYLSSSRAIRLAKESGARLHVFHLSTAKELSLFRNDIPLNEKKITAEVCIHHLWFSNKDYIDKGNYIKWNPAIKTEKDREALWEGLNSDLLDVLATDHAPHTLEEKSKAYEKAPSGGPLVQHALPALLTAYNQKKISLEKIVEKACHNPAILFDIKHRGFIRKGYFADLVVIDLDKEQTIKKEGLIYKCGWSPFEGTVFKGVVEKTILNGKLAYDQGEILPISAAMALKFDR
ncbi:MAG: dihydroorotase [Flavobacteriaceae bacterium TMED179]|nr:MAG: dihydroorotase [Flavobacteriaceae bacterium TMED179]